ncbi:MAG: Crp/Fnr family transcriptional regulator [Terracidiphilus sp.]
MQTTSDAARGCGNPVQAGSEFFSKLSSEALKDLMSLEHPASYPSNMMLFSEKDAAQGVFVLLEGEVKLSINSSDGRRLILRIAKKGEILGLDSVISGEPSEMTAETLYPCKIAVISRQNFLGFMVRHPEAYKIVTEELGRQIGMACAQLRTVALSASAPEKLARLLLDFSRDGQTTATGVRIRFSLTHEEIGEFIGASRETVTRTLSIFKTRRLVDFRGSTLTIPNKTALASYAGC